MDDRLKQAFTICARAILDPRTGPTAIKLAIEGRRPDGWYDWDEEPDMSNEFDRGEFLAVSTASRAALAATGRSVAKQASSSDIGRLIEDWQDS